MAAIIVGMVRVAVRTNMLNKALCTTMLLSILLLTACSSTAPEVSQMVSGFVTDISFVSGMGCDDPSCMETSHHHNCTPDCTEYDHYHHCGLDCDDLAHNHHSSGHIGTSHHSDHD